MTPKFLFVLLLALFASAVAQNDDELQIPVENDNQFPPDNHPDTDGIEGSGAGIIDEPLEVSTGGAAPLLENVQLTSLLDNVSIAAVEEHLCPKPCVCNVEGDTNNYITDCSNYQLTVMPTPLDPKTTELNLQNNKLTEIPKEISDLKNLKTLNVNNNEIMKIVSGSISELPELVNLKLANNRLIEYPQDLKNSFGLTKLEVLDLGGNDMRTDLKTESFSNFKSLRSLTLPTAAASLAEDLCVALKESLATVCTESCDTNTFDCPEAPQPNYIDEYILPPVLGDPIVNPSPEVKTAPANNETKNEQVPPVTNVENNNTSILNNKHYEKPIARNGILPNPIVSPKDFKSTDENSTTEASTSSDIKIGAKTARTNTGGVDKSVIGIIVAGMVLVVAGITIKKNWSSIRNRFSSAPRNANDRTSVNANGTTPEEVPLQEKSPV